MAGKRGPKGPKGDPGEDGTCLLEGIRDRIESAASEEITNPDGSITEKLADRVIICEEDGIKIKDGAVEMTLSLGFPEENSVLMAQEDNKIGFGTLNNIGYKVTNTSTGESYLSGFIKCNKDRITFQTKDATYDWNLEGGQEQDVLQVRGGEIVLDELERISYSSEDKDGNLVERSSITATKDGLILSVGDSTFTMDLRGGSPDKALMVVGDRIIFGTLPMIGVTASFLDEKTGIVMYDTQTGLQCTESVIIMRTRSADQKTIYDYALNLANGKEGAPLIKKGQNIVFGEPMNKLGNIMFSPVIPDIADAKDNVLYFIYDEGSPYTQ